jgi:signal peptide peptidase-like protein 2B
MVCEANETDIDIGIPAVMLPQDAGETLKNYLQNKSTGMLHFFCYCVYLF